MPPHPQPPTLVNTTSGNRSEYGPNMASTFVTWPQRARPRPGPKGRAAAGGVGWGVGSRGNGKVRHQKLHFGTRNLLKPSRENLHEWRYHSECTAVGQTKAHRVKTVGCVAEALRGWRKLRQELNLQDAFNASECTKYFRDFQGWECIAGWLEVHAEATQKSLWTSHLGSVDCPAGLAVGKPRLPGRRRPVANSQLYRPSAAVSRCERSRRQLEQYTDSKLIFQIIKSLQTWGSQQSQHIS